MTHLKRTKKIAFTVLTILFYIVLVVLLFLTTTGHALTDWYKQTFHTRIREIIYTFNLGLEGADASFLNKTIPYCKYELVLFVLLLILIIAFEIVLHFKIKKTNDDKNYKRTRLAVRFLLFSICLTGTYFTYTYADKVLEINDFLKSRLLNTNIYEKQYVDPNKVSIIADNQHGHNKRNLIMIYVESMETTYASKELGGARKHNLIPNLTELQNKNYAFGNQGHKKVRGSYNPYGTTWTTAAILSTSGGIPFNFHVGMNQMGKEDAFAPGVTTIGDILKSEGYTQEFMCGSDSKFGGKKKFFKDHGDFDIFDYNTAIEKGYIDKNYHVWWGLEDHILFDMAKDELDRLSDRGKPFNFTLLTVDTHHVGGYKCKWCPNEYKSKTANVVKCADKQVSDFVHWCSTQSFYNNTTIVVVGDHPRMDTRLVRDTKQNKRASYNCFINPDQSVFSSDIQSGEKVNTDRLAVSMDIFPTTLAAMGYSINGDRLGLGTNLFSERKTLAEEMTYEKLSDELGKNSEYYQQTFSKKTK